MQYIIRLLALTGCADTIVGSNLVRGISGGQRKRVTSGEMIVGCVLDLNLIPDPYWMSVQVNEPLLSLTNKHVNA